MQQLLEPAQCCFILYFEDAHPDEETARDGLRVENGRKIPLPFLLMHFYIGSGTTESGNRREINGCTEMNQHGQKLDENGRRPETLVGI
jgi:hypothetical protein